MAEKYHQQHNKSANSNQNSQKAEEVITPSNLNQEGEFDYFAHYRGKKATSLENKTSELNSWESEVLRYLESIVIDIKADPITWWQHNKHHYPMMFTLATRLLSCPASSIESERVFSIGTQIYTPKRNRIGAKTAEQLMYLNYNLRFMKENKATYEFVLDERQAKK